MSKSLQKTVRVTSLGIGLASLWFVLCGVSSSHADNPQRGWADTTPTDTELGATNVGWFYRWGLTKPSGNYDASFVPMFWGGSSVTTANINQVIGYGDTTHVLGFNEPDRPNQANMSVATAISKWQTLQDGFAGTGIKLVSPAVSDNQAGQQWLADFMTEVDNQQLQIDAIAFHWYGVDNPNNPAGAANQLLNRVDSYYSTYGRPIWLTEFAIHDWGDNYTDEEIRAANKTFLEHVIPGLESRSYVEKFAFYNWFSDSTMIEGNPLAPTIVGDPYVGTIGSGQTFDLDGLSQGNDTMYLKGGEITNTGTAQADAIRFLDALESTSRISGSADWSVRNQGWVRVRSGATLSKTGSNQITWSDVNVANEGAIHVTGGTLQLERDTTFSGAGVLRVDPGATLSLGSPPDRTGVTLNQPVELRGGTIKANVISDGSHVLPSGATLYQSATFSGDGVLYASGPLVAPMGGGGGGIIKEGTGTLYLSATNTFEGDTVIKQGALRLSETAALTNTPRIRVESGGTLDVTDFPAGYVLHGQELATAGRVEGSILATNGSTITAHTGGVITGNLSVDDSVVRIGDVATVPSIVSTGLQLNFDAAEDAAGDATWTNGAAPGAADLAFAANASPVAVSDAAFPRITRAYDIASTGPASGLNGYFELQSPQRSRQDATFEVVFHVSDTTAGPDQVLFEAGAVRGVSFLLSDGSLSFNVDGDGDALRLSTQLTTGWHHAVGVIDLVGMDDDLPNDSLKLYVNNTLVGAQTGVLIDDWAGGNVTGLGGPAAGAAGTATPGDYHGEIAAARYYNNLAFGETEVSQNYQALLDPTQFVGPATLHVNGDFTQNAGSTLAIDLYAGIGNDLLTVMGTFTAGGNLDISLVGPDPVPGETFQIFDAAAYAGAFSNIHLPGDPAGWNTSRLLIDGTLTFGTLAPSGDFNNDGLWNCDDINALSNAIISSSTDLSFDINGDGMITPADITEPGTGWLAVGGANNTSTGGNPFVNGDADLNGSVDGSDFNAWNGNKFSSNANWCDGNFDASGGIDGSDFNIWNVNKFTSSLGMSAVPEPGAGLITFLGLFFWALASIRRGRRTSVHFDVVAFHDR